MVLRLALALLRGQVLTPQQIAALAREHFPIPIQAKESK